MKESREDPEFIDAKTSKRILQAIKEQQEEIKQEEAGQKEETPSFFQNAAHMANKTTLSDEEYISDAFNEQAEFEYENMSDNYEEIMEIDEADYELMEKFIPKEPKKQLNLSELIMKKIEESNNAPSDEMIREEQEIRPEQIPGLNPRVIEVYTKLGLLLSRYKSGKLPKAFKIIPSLANWMEILYITKPEEWTPHATYEATKLFVSNLKTEMAQRFMNLILMDKVRDDIRSSKKLNYHLYMALKKALYKPAAFFKGILLPLCDSGSCTLREAAIIGSVLSKVSVPMLHSAAALLKLADLDYTGANSLFIRVLLDKKYALPYRVIDALVFHFLRFKSDHREMPVLWHQSMLIFVQRYKSDLTPEQKEALLDLLKYKVHSGVSPEIRREIQNSTCRGDMMDAEMVGM